MNFTGVLINSMGVFLAGMLGSYFKKSISEKVRSAMMIGLGLCVLYIGISGVSASTNFTVMVFSILAGVLAGEFIDIDYKLKQLGVLVQKKITSKGDNLADGFISSTLFVCVGAMSIVGGIESGTQGTYNTFLAKTFIDSIVIFIMAATKGKGCCLAAAVALIYQSSITLLAGYIASIVNITVISQMSEIGSLLIIGIALNLLKVTDIKISNFVLSPFIPILFAIGQEVFFWFLS